MSLIVVGVDGSEQSRRALMWALRYGAGRSAVVQAVMVVNTKDLDEQARVRLLEDAERSVSAMVDRAVQGCTRPPTVGYEVVEGDPSVVLVDATQRAELIVFGAHRMSSIRQVALGTVSLACIRMGACPVLVIPVGAPVPTPCSELVPA
jgi:nucleotide-binding universal stress UspA family protein